ncbi:MAG: isopentenyl-diphosphate Delta-isomerase [Lachnospiraceae bacterium]|nr:isopentenyl-diphosphate Delta-isomerase [Lachnospiraceae bacterium]
MAHDISSGAKENARQEEDMLIWVDRADRETGSGPKLRTHEIGQLHRAFSVFILDPQQKRILLQKRAAGKYHSGGLWSNACCSHPRVGETTEEAVLKRLAVELGFTPDAEEKRSLTRCGSFIYHADFGPLSEHEVDHVYTCFTDPDTFRMDAFSPEEIEALRWMDVSDMERHLAEHPEEFSAWFAPAWKLARAALSPAGE